MKQEEINKLALIGEVKILQERVGNFANEKEKKFLISVQDFIHRVGYMTTSQKSWFETISDKYSEERIAEENQWKATWNSEKRTTAIQVAEYYKGTPYFSNMVSDILLNKDDFFLSKRQWDKFCCNKYARKIINQYNTPPVFQVGDCVESRATNKITSLNSDSLRSNRSSFFGTGFIIKVNSRPITRAAKGSRIYSVLFTGQTKPLLVHESDIKKRRKKK